MAQYSNQRPRHVPSPPGVQARDVGDRDTFSYIFGQERPSAVRAQTMGARSGQVPQDRAQTMSTPSANMMQRMPPPRHPQPHSYDSPTTNGYQIPNGTVAPPPAPADRRIPTLPPLQKSNNYSPSGPLPNRQPYIPQRVDSRPSYPAPQQLNPAPNRGYPPPNASTPALNSDTYRSQSLAAGTKPPPFRAGGVNNTAPANAFRQQPYKLSHTTAQGRAIPERHDERTMSMTSFARDGDFSQTPSGRVIPNRRRESGADSRPSTDTSTSDRTYTNNSTLPNEGRSMSMASTLTAPTDRSFSMMSTTSRPSTGPQRAPRRRSPLVYPALLSHVAKAFRERVNLSDREKDGLVYKSAFSGSEAVDMIAYIMQTTDRNLALLLGRSLDAQKFFHDVTYDHRLRDSPREIYQFKETLIGVEDDEEGDAVNGVFTLTTECYSPTCTPDRLCYSIACPKRIDQQKRLNMKPQPGLQKSLSHESLHEDQGDEQKLWINTVSKEVAESVDERERKRQEVISELCYTERDFVKDLEYLQDFWVRPLRTLVPPVIPDHRRERFIPTVFGNFADIYGINMRLAEALTRRQYVNPVVRNVGDILLDFVPRFVPSYINYGANQLWGKIAYEEERKENPFFKRFAEGVERLKESRRLELNGYLTKPTSRLARYPLLLEQILKNTADGNPDKEHIPKAIERIRKVLEQVNAVSGQQENKIALHQVERQLVFKPGESYDLDLISEERQLLFKGSLKKNPTDNSADIVTYLFDNAVLFTRAKTSNKKEELRVYKKPIPLGLLIINQMEEVIPRVGLAKRPSSSLIPGSRQPTNPPRQEAKQQQGHPLTFKHIGKGSFEVTLYATSQIQREKYIKLVNEQQEKMRERKPFEKSILTEGFFNANTRITSGVPIDGGRKFVVGTDAGVYLVDRKNKQGAAKPRRVLDVRSVTQIDVLEQHSILLVLTEKTLYSYSTSILEADENALSASRRGRKISGCNFFKTGVFDGQHLVCCVKTSALSATVKVYKPMETVSIQKKKGGLSNLFAGGQDVLRPYKVKTNDPPLFHMLTFEKEFYVPTETYSVHFLRSSLCVGCARGFEIVTLDTLVTQPLLDQADTSLDFVALKENLRPIHVERINQAFLLCYSDFSFFVNKHGWRADQDWRITWEGNPQSFAIHQPYILAFEPNFIEIRVMETGAVAYIQREKNVRMLHSSTREVRYPTSSFKMTNFNLELLLF